MGSTEVAKALEEFGVLFVNNNIILGKYQFGRLGETHLYPIEESTMDPIPLDSVESFSSLNNGRGDFTLTVSITDRGKVELPRTEYNPPRKSDGFVFNEKGDPLMPSSISELMSVWYKILPDFKDKCWKEETTGFIMVDLSLVGGSGIEELSTAIITRMTATVQNRLKDFGCKGKQPNKELVYDVLQSEATDNSRNAFLEMMRGVLWDKIPRMDSVFTDVFGGRMLSLSDEDSAKVLKEISRCWFLGAVERQHKPTQLDIIPIMIGDTNIRKSSAAKWLAVEEGCYGAPLDMNEKKFVEESKGKLVMELTEMKATKGVDNDFLKGFLSRDQDHIRLPYDKCASKNIRRFVLIGTTNEWEMLTDPTGNRRYFPFEVSADRAFVHFGEGGFRNKAAKEYIRQVWAEAYSRYLSGERHELSAEALELSKISQDSAIIYDPNADLLGQLIDRLYPLPGSRVCKKDLIYQLGQNHAIYGLEAEAATETWWRTPNREWSKSKSQRIGSAEHEWLKDIPSVVQKCKTRLYSPGGAPKGACGKLGE